LVANEIIIKNQSNIMLLLLLGVITGVLAGCLGIGGGFLIAPALLLWAGMPIETAVGTTLFIITINSIAGFSTSYTSIIAWFIIIVSVYILYNTLSSTLFYEHKLACF
jgi:uncharacterized membrane protein YfcA